MKQKNKIARRARQRTFKYFLFVMLMYALVYGVGIAVFQWFRLFVAIPPMVSLVYDLLMLIIAWFTTNWLMHYGPVVSWIKTF